MSNQSVVERLDAATPVSRDPIDFTKYAEHHLMMMMQQWTQGRGKLSVNEFNTSMFNAMFAEGRLRVTDEELRALIQAREICTAKIQEAIAEQKQKPYVTKFFNNY